MGEQPPKRQYLEPGEQQRFNATVLIISVLLVAGVLGGYVLYTLDGYSDARAAEEDERMGRTQQTSAPVTPPPLPTATVTATLPTGTPAGTPAGPPTETPTFTPTTVTAPAPTQTATGPVPCPGGTGRCLRGSNARDIYWQLGKAGWYCTDQPDAVQCDRIRPGSTAGTTESVSLRIGTSSDKPSRTQSITATVSISGGLAGRDDSVNGLRVRLGDTLLWAMPDEPITAGKVRTWFDTHVGTAAATSIDGYRLTTLAVTDQGAGSWAASAALNTR